MLFMGYFNVLLDVVNCKYYLVFVVGSGIMLMIFIIKIILLVELYSCFMLVYVNCVFFLVIFKEEIIDFKDVYFEWFNVIWVMSCEQQDVELFNGCIDCSKCDVFFVFWIDFKDVDVVFLCGLEEMVQVVFDLLQVYGMFKVQIKIELFVVSVFMCVYVLCLVVGKKECEVMVIVDGYYNVFIMDKEKEFVFDVGFKYGIDLCYFCKGGVCVICCCKVVEGKVDMDVNYVFEDYEIVCGFVLSCQFFLVSDKLLLDFDQDN